ncbi:MAG TPA: competence protein ComE [Desulfobulbaceae bacterium]|nr:competence protein ComE [Desulfobulbaceae bacterium]
MKRLFYSVVLLLIFATSVFAKVNINSATVAELEALPGVGQAKAEAIVKYREEKGKFKSAEDLKNVQGIGDKLYEKISSEIEVGK